MKTTVFLLIPSLVLTNASAKALQSGAAVCSRAKRRAALIPRQINFDRYAPTGPIGRAQFTGDEPFRCSLLFPLFQPTIFRGRKVSGFLCNFFISFSLFYLVFVFRYFVFSVLFCVLGAPPPSSEIGKRSLWRTELAASEPAF